MSEERITQWAAVDAERNVIATFKDHKDAGWYATARALNVVRLMQVGYTESIVDTAELSALREQIEALKEARDSVRIVGPLTPLDLARLNDEAAKFERETAARLLAALVMRGAPHIGQHETEPLLSLARQMADHYFPAKERTS